MNGVMEQALFAILASLTSVKVPTSLITSPSSHHRPRPHGEP